MKVPHLLFSLAIGLSFNILSNAHPTSSSTSNINGLPDLSPHPDNRHLSLPASTIRHLDHLFQELQPQPGKVIKFDAPQYTDLLTRLQNGSYIPPTPILPSTSSITLSKSEVVTDGSRQGILYYYGPKCETSNASPSRKVARDFLNIIRMTWALNYCDQDNRFGSRCRTLGEYRGVRFGICGDSSDWKMRCLWLFPMWEALINACGNYQSGKVGGQYKMAYENIYPDSQRWIVYDRVQIF